MDAYNYQPKLLAGLTKAFFGATYEATLVKLNSDSSMVGITKHNFAGDIDERRHQ